MSDQKKSPEEQFCEILADLFSYYQQAKEKEQK